MRFLLGLVGLFLAPVLATAAVTNGQKVAVMFNNAPKSPGFLLNCSSTFSVTNQLEQSQALATSPWTATGAVVAAPTMTNNAAVAPDGTTTATSMVMPAVSGTNAGSYVYQTTTGTGTLGRSTTSIWIKGASGGETIWLMQAIASGPSFQALKIVATTSWQRYTLANWSQTSATQYTEIGTDLRYGSATSTSAQTVYLWGAQLTDDNRSWPNIVTTTATVTVNEQLDCPLGVKFRDWSYLVAWTGNPITPQNTGAWNAGGTSAPYLSPWNPVISGSKYALANCTEASPNRTWNWQCLYLAPPGNPINWTDYGSGNPVVTATGSWDATFLLHGFVAPQGACSLNTWCVYVNGKGGGGGQSIGIWSSPDFVNWTAYASNPVLTGNGQNVPYVREVNGLLYLYAGLNNGNNGNVLVYTSSIGDGVNWTFLGAINYTPISGIDWQYTNYDGVVDSMVHKNTHGFYEMTNSINFTVGLPAGAQKMSYAVGNDGVHFWPYQTAPMINVPSRAYPGGTYSIGDGVMIEQAGEFFVLYNYDNTTSLSAGQAAMMPDQ